MSPMCLSMLTRPARQMVGEARHQSVAASLSVFSLVGGLLVGSAMSRLWIKLL